MAKEERKYKKPKKDEEKPPCLNRSHAGKMPYSKKYMTSQIHPHIGIVFVLFSSSIPTPYPVYGSSTERDYCKTCDHL